MIEVGCEEKKCVLSRLYSTYPMKLLRQSAFQIINDEYISIIILGYGGGLVQGDKNVLSINLNKDAKLTLRTQGSTKIFKCDTDKICINNISATLSENSILAFFPDPTTCYPGSRFKQSYTFKLESSSSSLMLVDWFTSGRQNRDIDWNMDAFENKTIIKIKDKIVYIENIKLSNNTFGNIASKVGNSNVFGSIVLVGPLTANIVERLQVFTHRQNFYEYRHDISINSHHNQQIMIPETMDRQKSIISVTNLITHSSHIVHLSSNDKNIDNEVITIVRFSLPTVEEGYELLAEIFKPMNTILTSCQPYYDRLPTTNTTNTTTMLPNNTNTTTILPNNTILANTTPTIATATTSIETKEGNNISSTYNNIKYLNTNNEVVSNKIIVSSSSRLVNILRKYDIDLINTKSRSNNHYNIDTNKDINVHDNDLDTNKDINVHDDDVHNNKDINVHDDDIDTRFNEKPTKLQRLN